MWKQYKNGLLAVYALILCLTGGSCSRVVLVDNCGGLTPDQAAETSRLTLTQLAGFLAERFQSPPATEPKSQVLPIASGVPALCLGGVFEEKAACPLGGDFLLRGTCSDAAASGTAQLSRCRLDASGPRSLDGTFAFEMEFGPGTTQGQGRLQTSGVPFDVTIEEGTLSVQFKAAMQEGLVRTEEFRFSTCRCAPDPSSEKTLCSALADADGDFVPDAEDNCTLIANPDQGDTEEDGIGDACDLVDDSQAASACQAPFPSCETTADCHAFLEGCSTEFRDSVTAVGEGQGEFVCFAGECQVYKGDVDVCPFTEPPSGSQDARCDRFMNPPCLIDENHPEFRTVCESSLCGNGFCGNLGEDCGTCPQDCGPCGCGDGVVDADGEDDLPGTADDEDCDPNDPAAGDQCRVTCEIEACGDGYCDPGEACGEDDYCPADCDPCGYDIYTNPSVCESGISCEVAAQRGGSLSVLVAPALHCRTIETDPEKTDCCRSFSSLYSGDVLDACDAGTGCCPLKDFECGDGVCTAGLEDCQTCPADCGDCPTGDGYCGDGFVQQRPGCCSNPFEETCLPGAERCEQCDDGNAELSPWETCSTDCTIVGRSLYFYPNYACHPDNPTSVEACGKLGGECMGGECCPAEDVCDTEEKRAQCEGDGGYCSFGCCHGIETAFPFPYPAFCAVCDGGCWFSEVEYPELTQQDADGDGLNEIDDLCPSIVNPKDEAGIPIGNADCDGDTIGDACDNCPSVFNPDQANSEFIKDLKGDACDDDIDGDGLLNEEDLCPRLFGATNEDGDGDGTGDLCDKCPLLFNPDQQDSDFDGVGDLCDNCPTSYRDQTDGDGDGVGDVCDNCPNTPNPGQEFICPVCGNFLIEPGEECDDGNTFDGDGCDALCVVEAPAECPVLTIPPNPLGLTDRAISCDDAPGLLQGLNAYCPGVNPADYTDPCQALAACESAVFGVVTIGSCSEGCCQPPP